MTIKQQGGIFGRNPTFNDVTIENNLTITDDITAQSVTAETATITDTSSSFVNLYLTGSTSSTCRILMGDTDSGVVGQIRYSNSAESMEFRTGNSTAATFNSSGNLAFPSGQGIDFSATSGTGTSELFDDYEEGNWTPAFDTTNGDLDVGTGTISAILAKYTKVGNRVFLEARFSMASPFTSVGTGDVIITGLPFASSSSGGEVSSVKIGYAYRFSTAAPISGYTTGSEIRLLTTAYTTASAFTAMPAANLNITGSNKNVIALSVNYEAV